MVSKKMVERPEIWNDITWLITIHRKLYEMFCKAEEKGYEGDETAMLVTIVATGWMEAFRRRIEPMLESNGGED